VKLRIQDGSECGVPEKCLCRLRGYFIDEPQILIVSYCCGRPLSHRRPTQSNGPTVCKPVEGTFTPEVNDVGIVTYL
jgi:hypothetical protein